MYYIKRKKNTDNKTTTKGTNKGSKTKLIAKLDRIFSQYIRLRDCNSNGYCKCISCGRFVHVSQIDCGHFMSRRHMATRFDEDNCSGECKYCNRFDASHLVGYQRNLELKIGATKVEKLVWKAKTPKHFLDSELEEMIEYYKNEVKRLQTLKGVRLS